MIAELVLSFKRQGKFAWKINRKWFVSPVDEKEEEFWGTAKEKGR